MVFFLVHAAAAATKVVQRERKRVIRVPLAVGGPGLVSPGLSDAERKGLAARLAALAAADATKREAAGAKNALEAYILSTRCACCRAVMRSMKLFRRHTSDSSMFIQSVWSGSCSPGAPAVMNGF